MKIATLRPDSARAYNFPSINQQEELRKMTERHSTQGSDQGRRIAFVQSCWHKDLVDQSRTTFIAEIGQLGIPESQIDFFEVTGAFEIPLHAMRLAESGIYAAIVAAGLVVDGGIYRHEFVADAVIGGLMRVQLDTGVPVLSAVLTPHHFHEHETHRAFFFEHLETKGVEAARACAHTIDALERLPTSSFQPSA